MSQPPHIQRIVPCHCGSTEAYWHGPEDVARTYACDACWTAALKRQRPAATDECLLKALHLAREATNSWACYAKRQIEHDAIARLHQEISMLERQSDQSKGDEDATVR